MQNIAVLLTCYNRREKTVACLQSVRDTLQASGQNLNISIYLTNDGCTDGTEEAVRSLNLPFPLHILQGDGSLFWNGGMIKSWSAAVADGGYDGYLWLNDDTTVLGEFWEDLVGADAFSTKQFGKGGIYVGSTRDKDTKAFTYGGFNFVNKWTLKDEMVIPDGKTFQLCQCGHGNITYVSADVVKKMGIFYEGYQHGASDHDYTYRAFKKGFPIVVLPHYAGECENNHLWKSLQDNPVYNMSLKERMKYMKSPFGYNLHNSLLFQKRCFPYRYPFAFVCSYFRLLFPKVYNKIRLLWRTGKWY